MDAVTAVDAFFFIDHAQAVLIVGNCVDRTGSSAGSYRLNDRAKGAGFGTLAAGLAFVRIDLHLGVARGDCSEAAGVEAGFAEAETAAVCDSEVLDRTVIAGGRDDSDNIFCGVVDVGISTHCESDSAAYDLAFFVDAAAVGRFRSRTHIVDNPLALFVREIIVPCHAADFPDHVMFQFDEAFVIGDHTSILSLMEKSRTSVIRES